MPGGSLDLLVEKIAEIPVVAQTSEVVGERQLPGWLVQPRVLQGYGRAGRDRHQEISLLLAVRVHRIALRRNRAHHVGAHAHGHDYHWAGGLVNVMPIPALSVHHLVFLTVEENRLAAGDHLCRGAWFHGKAHRRRTNPLVHEERHFDFTACRMVYGHKERVDRDYPTDLAIYLLEERIAFKNRCKAHGYLIESRQIIRSSLDLIQ